LMVLGSKGACFPMRRTTNSELVRTSALYGLQLDGMSFEMLITMLEEYGHTGLSDQTG